MTDRTLAVDVGGTVFTFSQNTVVGPEHAKTLLYSIFSNCGPDVYRKTLRFDRVPEIFKSILYYYFTGIFDPPPNFSIRMVEEELRYWKMPADIWYNIPRCVDQETKRKIVKIIRNIAAAASGGLTHVSTMDDNDRELFSLAMPGIQYEMRCLPRPAKLEMFSFNCGAINRVAMIKNGAVSLHDSSVVACTECSRGSHGPHQVREWCLTDM